MKRDSVHRVSVLAGIVFLALALFAGNLCRAATEPLDIFVSIPPEAYLADRVGGDHVKVHTLADKGQDPHTFEPAPRQIVDLGHADLYFTMGLPFEHRLLEKIKSSREKLVVVDISKGITKRLMSADHHEDGESKEAGHQQGEPDPHIWLSPPLLKIMAGNIAEALSKAAPEYRSDFQKNFDALAKDIDAVNARIKEILKPFSGQTFLVYHPAFGYFADAYGLHQEAVELEGKSPTPRHLAQLISEARAKHVKIIFVQPQFDKTSAEAIADAIGGTVIEMDSLAYDVLGNLQAMADKIERSFAAK